MTISKTPAEDSSQTPPAEQTRLALIRAALSLFGEQGFEGTSTRQIAAAAKANIGSIAYHFGGKEGLRIACAEHIASTMSTMAAQVLAAAPEPERLTPAAARALMKTLMRTMVAFLVGRQESGEFVQFILREMAHPTAALDTIYSRMFAPLHIRLCRVWAAATGEEPESPATRITIFSLIGQVVYFRIAREAVLRRMGWTEIGTVEAEAIIAAIGVNLDAMLDARAPRAGEGSR